MVQLAFAVSGGHLEIPSGVIDHASFLRWLRTADLPDDLGIGFVNGHLWIDPVPERAFPHNRIKTHVGGVLDHLVLSGRLGVYFGDGMLFTSPAGDFTTSADGLFVSKETDAAGRVWLEGAKEGEEDTRLVGTPDMVVEVVSDGSETKDTEWLMSAYHNAGIGEYWLIDARRDPVQFTIYRWKPKGFVAVRNTADGWIKSQAFGKSFRIVTGEAALGKRDHLLEVR